MAFYFEPKEFNRKKKKLSTTGAGKTVSIKGKINSNPYLRPYIKINFINTLISPLYQISSSLRFTN